jgi:glycerophosphoryl diester phosphodiesterase
MLIIGHRGASGIEPENTIRSFKKAEEAGVDMIELDVRRSKDGEIVVVHDSDLLRIFGDPRTIRSLTLAEIKRVSTEYNREIPTLDEVLANIRTDLNIEIKVHGIEQQVLSKIKNFPHKVLISCFYPGILKKLRTLDEKIGLALLLGVKRFHIIGVAGYYAKKLKLAAIHPNNNLVFPAIIALLRLSGSKINVYTVNSKREYERMKKLKVDGIFTNYPELMKQYEDSRI